MALPSLRAGSTHVRQKAPADGEPAKMAGGKAGT